MLQINVNLSNYLLVDFLRFLPLRAKINIHSHHLIFGPFKQQR